MNHQVRKLTEGAMMCALFGAVLMLDRQLAGMFEMYYLFVLPIPIALYGAKYGFKNCLVAAVSILFLTLMIASPTGIFFALMSVTVGTAYGALVHKKAKNGVLIIVTMLLTIVTEILSCLVLASFFGYSIVEEAALIKDALDMYMGDAINSVVMNLDKFIMMIIVMSIVLTGVLEGFLVHLLSNALLKRMKIDVHPFKPLSQWTMPRWAGFVCLAGYLLFVFSNRLPVDENVQLVIMAVGMIGMGILDVYGYVACLVWGMVKYKKNISFMLILTCFLFMSVALHVLAIFGFYYVSTDFKEIILRRDDDE